MQKDTISPNQKNNHNIPHNIENIENTRESKNEQRINKKSTGWW